MPPPVTRTGKKSTRVRPEQDQEHDQDHGLIGDERSDSGKSDGGGESDNVQKIWKKKYLHESFPKRDVVLVIGDFGGGGPELFRIERKPLLTTTPMVLWIYFRFVLISLYIN